MRFLGSRESPDAFAGDDALCLTGRDYWEPLQAIPGYSIPLPAGRYGVSLSLVEKVRGTPSAGADSRASFEVLLEKMPIPAHVEAGNTGAATPAAREVEVEVVDGALDIDFVRRFGDPLITAIEVRRL
ncbi:MAG TPA: hypothetical protein VMT52_00285 [Planctomycetota bacterium]|nr:hypothetical protein [Planctomycetota bacterium]